MVVSEVDPVIEVEGLHKRYGDRSVLRGVDLVVARGEVFGLLGPNGAGKTTTIEILEGFRQPDRGTRARPRLRSRPTTPASCAPAPVSCCRSAASRCTSASVS